MKQRAPALPDSPTFQQLWDALGSKLLESTREHLLYTQGGRGSSPTRGAIQSIWKRGSVHSSVHVNIPLNWDLEGYHCSFAWLGLQL